MFVLRVLERVRPHAWDLDADTEELFERYLTEFHDAGWSEGDAYDWLMCTEEVSPQMNEDRACRRMDALSSKYAKRNQADDVESGSRDETDDLD